MKRKIYSQLIDWKANFADKYALLIDGARRVGKSWIAVEFAKNEYESYMLIDFTKVNRQIKELFNNSLDDLDSFFSYLQVYMNVKLFPKKSLIIFDEVQSFPRAREAIKHLVADGRYHYIETGSLISIQQNVKNILIPSEEIHLKMYPMDFEEFIWATGNDLRWEYVKECFSNQKPLGQELHRIMQNIFREYLIVGGMPQVVNCFVDSQKDFDAVSRVKQSILDLYKGGIQKHAGRHAYKVEAIFHTIPSALSRHEKKFKPSDIKPNTRTRDYDSALFWLKDSMIVNLCYNSTEPNIGLSLNLEQSTLKCYMADTGLLINLAFGENKRILKDVHSQLLQNNLSLNEGMLVENIVAQMIVASGKELYFYSKNDKLTNENTMEIDFLVTNSNLAHKKNICPIEVKSGRSYSTRSLDKFEGKYKKFLGTSYVCHTKDFEIRDNRIFLPLYMLPLALDPKLGS